MITQKFHVRIDFEFPEDMRRWNRLVDRLLSLGNKHAGDFEVHEGTAASFPYFSAVVEDRRTAERVESFAMDILKTAGSKTQH